jgi:hypothetical protein
MVFKRGNVYYYKFLETDADLQEHASIQPARCRPDGGGTQESFGRGRSGDRRKQGITGVRNTLRTVPSLGSH